MSTLWEKDTPKSEWNKIKKQSPKDIVWYIWEYYKWPIFAVIVVIWLIVSWAISYRESRKDIVIYGALMNKYQATLADSSYFLDTYAAFRHTDTSKQRVELRNNLYIDITGDNLSEDSIGTVQILMAEIAAKNLDFIASDQKTLVYYNKSSSIFMDLRECLPADVYEQFEEEGRIVWLPQYDFDNATSEYIESEEEYPLLVDFSDSHFVEGMNFTNPELYVGFITNTTRTDEIPYFVDYMEHYDEK